MSKQRPDPDKMANELSGASAFFRRATPPPAPEAVIPRVEHTDEKPAASETLTPDTSLASERRDVTTARRNDVTPARTSTSLDINQPTSSHDTLRLSSEETRAIEELKSALKWEHGVTVSKNDICRVAIHELIEEYRTKGPTRATVKRLKKKLGRQ